MYLKIILVLIQAFEILGASPSGTLVQVPPAAPQQEPDGAGGSRIGIEVEFDLRCGGGGRGSTSKEP